jgi:hypothetical protein
VTRAAPILLAGIGAAVASIADDTSTIPAGMYLRVEDVFTQEFLDLEADGSYRLTAMADAGAYWNRVAGEVSRIGASLFLSEPGPRLVAELRVVHWGHEVFLVEPGDFEWFCNFSRTAAGKPKKGTISPPCIFFPSGKGPKAYPTARPQECTTAEP